MKMIRLLFVLFVAFLLIDGPLARAEEKKKPAQEHGDLAATATNPIGNLIQIQLQNQYNIDHSIH